MSIILGFFVCVMSVAGWWLLRQGLTSKPWLETGASPVDGVGPPTAKIGLAVFLVVVGGLFALFGSAVTMRMGLADWFDMQLPRVVWLNTALLVIASVFLQIAVGAARRDEARLLRHSLAAAGVATIGFLAGQALAFHQLMNSGEATALHPGAGFFYLITGLHGLHILGGLAALGRVGWRLRTTGTARLGIEMCAIYWHVLLIVWLAMVAILMGWTSDIAALCRSILS